MRIVNRYLTFSEDNKLTKVLNQLQIPFREERKSLDATVSYYVLEFFIYEEDPDFINRTDRLKAFKIEPQIGTEFSKEDEENAEWFMISVGQFGYPQPQDSYFELTYSKDNGCPQCQIGKQQVSPFRFKSEPNAKRSQFLGLNWVFDEIFIRNEAISTLAQHQISGLRYSYPVLNKTKLPLQSLQQIHVDTILEPGVLYDNLSHEICEQTTDKEQIEFIKQVNPDYLNKVFCGQRKYNFPKRGALTFKKEVFENMPDFVKTFEWFGSGGAASRPIIASQKVRQLILKENLRGASFTPIVLV